jgi:alkylhydroperoxidase/carboxymuconolactone decarboxylase family protein YurZ
MAVRRRSLGNAFVDDVIARTTRLNAEHQRYSLEHTWGRGWSRGVMTLREMSLFTIAMNTALNRVPEAAEHFKAAIRRGDVGLQALREVLILVAGTCGMPAAIQLGKTCAASLSELGVDLEGLGEVEEAGSFPAK